jgi:AcrR family transcriptional regulator
MGLSSQRARTRQAILDAAAAEWVQNSAASLSRVARTAGVGRATVHRYFPDRQHLHRVLVADSWAALRAAIDQAGPGTGSALEVIERIVSAMVHVGDRVRFLFTTTEGVPSDADARLAADVDDVVIAEIERGQRDGTLDAAVPARWIELIIWSTVYTGLHAAADGLVPRHGVDDLIGRTVRRAIGTHPLTTPQHP